MEVRIGKRTRKQWGATLIGVLGLIMLSTSVFGSGFETHEQGAKAVAMGGAFTAQADDPSAVFYNPANHAA
jgi:long-chain fatty acid transport protein